MKRLFTGTLIFFSINVFCQTYTYVEPNPALEKEKHDREAFFKKRKDDAFTRLQNCTKQCGSYAADANNPKDPCTLRGATPACICACNRRNDDSIRVIEQQENSWQADIARRERDYENLQKQALNSQIQTNDNELQSNSNNLNPVNDAISTTGKTIWDIIQNGRAKKAATGEALVNSFAQSLYDNKVNTKYYEHITNCDECNGTGIVPGHNIPCSYCNGLGKYYKPSAEYYKAQKTDPNSAEMTSLIQYLNSHQSNNPIYEFIVSGYNGIIRLIILNDCYTTDGYLVVGSKYIFRFLKENGNFDANAYQYGDLLDYKVIPSTAILGVKSIVGETKYSDGTSIQSFNHLGLILTNGENFEFNSNYNLDELNTSVKKLVEYAKNSDRAILPSEKVVNYPGKESISFEDLGVQLKEVDPKKVDPKKATSIMDRLVDASKNKPVAGLEVIGFGDGLLRKTQLKEGFIIQRISGRNVVTINQFTAQLESLQLNKEKIILEGTYPNDKAIYKYEITK